MGLRERRASRIIGDNGMQELKHFVKVDKVAEMFDVKVNTVWRWVSDGKLRSTKLAGATRFDPDHIQEFIARGQKSDVTA